MKLAFCLFHYFPYGGLERDFLKIAEACQKQGAEIHVYTFDWQGDLPFGFHLHFLKKQGWTNHARAKNFAKQLTAALVKEKYDGVIGFNKLPGLTIYYAADTCFVDQYRSFFSKCLPRYRSYQKLEAAVFSKGLPTKILCLTEQAKKTYQKYYDTEEARFLILPPGISQAYQRPLDVSTFRETLRARYKMPKDALVALMIASRFHTKGVDRAIAALAPSWHLIVVGEDRPCVKLPNVHFAGPCAEVSEFLWGADILLHPARKEAAGMVLLEALIAGLPVITTSVCGYASYIEKSQAGIVLSEPYSKQALVSAIKSLEEFKQRMQYQQNALAFCEHADLFSLVQEAVKIIF